MEVANTLGRVGDPRAIQPLVRALADQEWRVIEAAINALANIGDPGVVDALITKLCEDIVSGQSSLSTENYEIDERGFFRRSDIDG